MADIITQLMAASVGHPFAKIPWPHRVLHDAKDEIEHLRAENAKLRAALEPFAKAAEGFDTMPIKNPEDWFAYGGVNAGGNVSGAITVGDLRRARAALNEEKSDGAPQ